MRRRALAAGLAAMATPMPGRAAALTLRAADGLALHADLAEPPRAPRATILLFHMAGSNLGEYAPIAPELVRRGFMTLALDQRSGGEAFGRRNATAAALPRDPGYLAALPDLRAAAAWALAERPGPPLLLWGSSYSAALVFLLAAELGAARVRGLLAFSPGEYLQGVSVRSAAQQVTCPVFVTSSAQGAEIEAAAALLAATRGKPRTQFRPGVGAHGSSLLRPDRNPNGAATAWAAVLGFLDAVAPG